MWQIKLPGGETLDLLDTQIGIELNNSIFSTSNTDVLPGSFSFPITLPATDFNTWVLRNPGAVDTFGKPRPVPGVWVSLFGIPFFECTLTVREADDDAIRIDLIANPLAAVKDVLVSDLDLGGERTIGAVIPNWENHITACLNNPELYDYNFLPVQQVPGTEDGFFGALQNWTAVFGFDFGNVSAGTVTVVTPFPKLSYLLSRITAGTGWTLINHLQQDTELSRLYTYSNRDIRVSSDNVAQPSIPTSFRLNDFAPRIKVSELLRKTAAHFNCGVFYDYFQQKIHLRPIIDVLATAPAHDWTQYLTSGIRPEFEPGEVAGRYQHDAPQPLPVEWPPFKLIRHYRTFPEYSQETIYPDFAYIETLNKIVESRSANLNSPVGALNWLVTHRQQTAFAPDGPDLDGKAYESGIGSLSGSFKWNNELEFETDCYEYAGEYNRLTKQDIEGTELWRRTGSDAPLMLLAYRGRQANGNNPNAPVATNHVWRRMSTTGQRYDITGTGQPARYSLNWHGEYGLYNTFHRAWNTLLRNGKHCTATLSLPVTVLQHYRFDEKVRINNMDYILKKISVQGYSAPANAEVKVEMITTI